MVRDTHCSVVVVYSGRQDLPSNAQMQEHFHWPLLKRKAFLATK